MTKEEIGNILKSLRLKAMMTQQEVAAKIGRTQQVVGHWETGYSQPDADTLFTLCDLYGASIDKAFGYSEKSSNSENLKEIVLSTDETNLIKDYRMLNNEGQKVATEAVDALTYVPKYKKSDTCKELA